MNTIDMSVYSKPGWVKMKENSGKGRPTGQSLEHSANVQKALIQTFAEMQSESHETKRAAKAGASYREWQNIPTFWSMAVKGIRFPSNKKDDAKQEGRDLSFADPQVTHHF